MAQVPPHTWSLDGTVQDCDGLSHDGYRDLAPLHRLVPFWATRDSLDRNVSHRPGGRGLDLRAIYPTRSKASGPGFRNHDRLIAFRLFLDIGRQVALAQSRTSRQWRRC